MVTPPHLAERAKAPPLRSGGTPPLRSKASKAMDNPEESGSERPSKTQRKREMADLQSLGEKLVALNEQRIATVPMPDFLREAVLEARRIKGHEALRRQMQYIGKLMRETDPAPIRRKIEEWEGQSASLVAREHAIERWRERLLENDTALTEFASTYRGFDVQKLRACMRAARAERVAGKPPRHFRELFRLLRDAMETSAGEEIPDENGKPGDD